MTATLEMLGDRQRELLKALLRDRGGLTVDELTEELRVTRTAVNQHLSALEEAGYVERGERVGGRGRPCQTFRLSDQGYEIFPRQYSWFSEVLIDAIRREKGPEGLREFLRHLGTLIASGLDEQMKGLNRFQKIQRIVSIMNDLAYQAEASSPDEIRAVNCVYHQLAARNPEVCQFDLALLEKLSGSQVVHEECIIRGGSACRFRLKQKVS